MLWLSGRMLENDFLDSAGTVSFSFLGVCPLFDHVQQAFETLLAV